MWNNRRDTVCVNNWRQYLSGACRLHVASPRDVLTFIPPFDPTPVTVTKPATCYWIISGLNAPGQLDPRRDLADDQFQPDGWPTAIPRVFTEDVRGVVGFLKLVFGAHGEMRIGAPAEMRIGDSLILVSDGGPAREARKTFLYVYVENTDKAMDERSREALLP